MSDRLILILMGRAAHLPLQKFFYFVSNADMEIIQRTRPNGTKQEAMDTLIAEQNLIYKFCPSCALNDL